MRGRQLFMLQGLPGIGPARADRLLTHFGSLRRIFQASPDQWMEIKGIGKHCAAQIANLLDNPY
jgi:ERCC4-type nuclease